MTTHFADRRLEISHLQGDGRRLPPHLLARLGVVLDRMEDAHAPHDLDIPGYRLHQLAGDLAGFWAGFWSIRISGNWRLIFRFEGAISLYVRFVDYHSGAET